ncbi:MAG: tetratricopeptide repeat protein [Candidatus Gastranaerophilales bacterium]|nr:tetratricopeptide repeat protein [Candidatus Gastranaerophilales bacterium]
MLKFIRSTAMKIIILVLLLAAVIFCWKFPHKLVTAKNIVKAYYYVYKADEQYKNKNLFGAINLYQRALKYYPAHAKGNYNLANIYAVYEDYISALNYYEKAVLYKPKFMNARIALGILLSEKFFEYDRAIKEYDLAIKKAPFQLSIPPLIPIIYNNEEYLKYNKAVAYYNMGLAYKWKSLVYGQEPIEIKMSLQNAVKSYKNSLKYDKDNYETLFNLALALQLLHSNGEAKKVYCKCINMRPFDYDAHYNLAILLREENSFLDAMLELEKAALIVDAESDGYKSRYIYDVLNETSAKLHSQDNYAKLKEELDNSPLNNYEPTFINGKIVASEELDKAMLKNMRTCGACKNFNVQTIQGDNAK